MVRRVGRQIRRNSSLGGDLERKNFFRTLVILANSASGLFKNFFLAGNELNKLLIDIVVPLVLAPDEAFITCPSIKSAFEDIVPSEEVEIEI